MGPIYVQRLAPERIADVQRAVCTSGKQLSPWKERSARLGVKVTPCREPSARLWVKGPWPQYSYRGRKFKGIQIRAKKFIHLAPQDFSFFGPFWPDVQTWSCTFCKTCRPMSATAVGGPGGGGWGGGKPPPQSLLLRGLTRRTEGRRISGSLLAPL